jgi:DNA-binding NarL/FixJ family response regulator
MKILVFDDEVYISEVVKVLIKILKEMKNELEIVFKTDSAIDKIKNIDFDVIILDIMMPYKGTIYGSDETEGGIKTGSVFLIDFLIEGKFGNKNIGKKIIIFTNLSDYEEEYESKIKNILPDDVQVNISIFYKPYYEKVIDKIKSLKQ